MVSVFADADSVAVVSAGGCVSFGDSAPGWLVACTGAAVGAGFVAVGMGVAVGARVGVGAAVGVGTGVGVGVVVAVGLAWGVGVAVGICVFFTGAGTVGVGAGVGFGDEVGARFALGVGAPGVAGACRLSCRVDSGPASSGTAWVQAALMARAIAIAAAAAAFFISSLLLEDVRAPSCSLGLSGLTGPVLYGGVRGGGRPDGFSPPLLILLVGSADCELPPCVHGPAVLGADGAVGVAVRVTGALPHNKRYSSKVVASPKMPPKRARHQQNAKDRVVEHHPRPLPARQPDA